MSPRPPNKWSSETGGARGFLVSVGSLASARVFLAVSQILVLPITVIGTYFAAEYEEYLRRQVRT